MNCSSFPLHRETQKPTSLTRLEVEIFGEVWASRARARALGDNSPTKDRIYPHEYHIGEKSVSAL